MTVRHPIHRFAIIIASALSTPGALVVSLLLCVVASAIGIVLKSDSYTNNVNTALSWAAIFITIAILIDTRHESRATQAKIDELIRAIPEARNELIGIEAAEEEILEHLTHPEQQP